MNPTGTPPSLTPTVPPPSSTPPSTSMNSLNQAAQGASQQAQNLTTDAPGMLQQLKQNLVGIFANNNPIMSARNQAAQDYLGEANNARASMLPQNSPTINGRQVTFSPTQQQAVVDSRLGAALVPLAGYNQQIVGQYGNLNDLLANAGQMYNSAITGANQRAANLNQTYQNAIAQYSAQAQAAYNLGMGQQMQALFAKLAAAQNGDMGQMPPGSQGVTNVDPTANINASNFAQSIAPSSGLDIPSNVNFGYTQPANNPNNQLGLSGILNSLGSLFGMGASGNTNSSLGTMHGPGY